MIGLPLTPPLIVTSFASSKGRRPASSFFTLESEVTSGREAPAGTIDCLSALSLPVSPSVEFPSSNNQINALPSLPSGMDIGVTMQISLNTLGSVHSRFGQLR